MASDGRRYSRRYSLLRIGTLAQNGYPRGALIPFSITSDLERASVWEIGDESYTGIWISQDRFKSAEWSEESKHLTVRIGEVEIGIIETPGGQPEDA